MNNQYEPENPLQKVFNTINVECQCEQDVFCPACDITYGHFVIQTIALAKRLNYQLYDKAGTKVNYSNIGESEYKDLYALFLSFLIKTKQDLSDIRLELSRIMLIKGLLNEIRPYITPKKESLKPTIIINYDFTSLSDVSYMVGLEKCDQLEQFSTNCLEFFSQDYAKTHSVFVVKADGTKINLDELLLNQGGYTDKEIRNEHNLRKMLVAGAFLFK